MCTATHSTSDTGSLNTTSGVCADGLTPQLSVCGMMLQNPAARLAMLDALRNLPPASLTSALATFTAAASIHVAQVLPDGCFLHGGDVTPDRLAVQRILATLLSRATSTRLTHFLPLVSSAQALLSRGNCREDQAYESRQVKIWSARGVSEAMVSALLARPACAPLVINLAGSVGTECVSCALELLLQTAEHDTCFQGTCLDSLRGAAYQNSHHYGLRPSMDAGASGMLQNAWRLKQQAGHLVTDAFADLYLVLLSRSDPQQWRAHSRRLVFQMTGVVQCLSKHTAAYFSSATSSLSPSTFKTGQCAMEQDSSASQHDIHRNAVRDMYLLMQLLMPVMPIVYYDASMPASSNLRHTLASTLIDLLRQSKSMMPRHTQDPTLEVQLSWVLSRAVLLLHALRCEEWARWIVCHESRGVPQSPGVMVNQSAVNALATELPSAILNGAVK